MELIALFCYVWLGEEIYGSRTKHFFLHLII